MISPLVLFFGEKGIIFPTTLSSMVRALGLYPSGSWFESMRVDQKELKLVLAH